MPRRTLLFIAFAAVAIAGIGLVAVSLLSLRSYRDSADETLDAAQVAVLVQAILIDLQSAESAQRGYLLTGEDGLLAPYADIVERTTRRLEVIGESTLDNERQQTLIDQLEPTIAARFAEIDESLELYRNGDREGAIALLDRGGQESLYTRAFGLISSIVLIEADQHEQARDTADDRSLQSIIAVSALSVVVTLLLIWVFRTMRRQNVEESLRRSNREKDEFLGMVSHELRTPITVVLGNARLLRRAGDDLPQDERRRSLADIESHGERMQRIVENMLTLSREQVRTQTVEPVILGRIIDGTVARFTESHPGPRVDVVMRRDLPLVLANPNYVEQVLLNLLSNAQKYAGNQEAIEISAIEERGRVLVSVADRGPGVDAEKQERIFEAFVRLPGAESRAEGLGLGLPVCKRLLESQGGDIWVAARPGGGSVFTFSLIAVHDAEELERAETTVAMVSRGD